MTTVRTSTAAGRLTARPMPRAWMGVIGLLSVALLGLDLAATAPGPAGAAARVALAPSCHQDPARSLARGARPLGACARCVGLHAGGLLAIVAAAAFGARRLAAAGSVLAATAWACLFVLVAHVLAGILLPWSDLAGVRLATGLLASGSVCLWALAEMVRPASSPAPIAMTRVAPAGQS